MKNKIEIKPIPNKDRLIITSTELVDVIFNCTIPEAIGSSDHSISAWSGQLKLQPKWYRTEKGGWGFDWKREGELAFSADCCVEDSHVDIHINLKNLTDEAWPESQAFSCINFAGARVFADYEGDRTFLLIDEKWKPITSVERKNSPRPPVQLWYVKGKNRPLGFVENFQATPSFYPEGVLAARSRDGKHILAVSCDRPLYLFNNLEYSCIHCCPSFGALKPGEEGGAFHRVYILKDTKLDQLTGKLEALWNMKSQEKV